jgi:hypothetical protein
VTTMDEAVTIGGVLTVLGIGGVFILIIGVCLAFLSFIAKGFHH